MEIKNIILTIVGILLAGFVIALIIFNVNESNSTESEISSDVSTNAPLHEQYPGLPENNQFVKESNTEIVDRFTTGTGIIFLGFNQCEWCQTTAPLLNEAAAAEDMSVYYLDINQERENMTPQYNEIITILAPYLKSGNDGSVRISTPDISYVKNGQIVWRNELEDVPATEQTPDTYWTTERQERAVAQYREKIQLLKS